MSSIEAHLKKQGFLIADGATGTELMKLGALRTGVAPEQLCIDDPKSLIKVHRSYYEAGSDFVMTNTFGATRTKLEEWGLQKDLQKLNAAAVKCVRQALKESGRNGFVAADIGPCGLLMSPLGSADMEELILVFREQVKILHEEGVDLFMAETVSDLREAKAIYIAVRDVCKTPVGISLTYNAEGSTLVNNSPEAVAVAFDSTDILFIGSNCSVGPADMGSVMLRMAEYTDKPLLAKPNAGVSGNKFTVEDFKAQLGAWGSAGVKVFGGCCVSSPDYIKMMREEIPKIKLQKKIEKKAGSHLASHSKVITLGRDLPPVIIGERINPTNKKAMIEELKQGTLDIVKDFARTQIKDGAALLDVNVGAAGVDELSIMKKAINVLGSVVDAPLVIDSSRPNVVEAALRNYGGKALINSTTGEKEKAEQILALAKKYGAAVLVLAMDEKGIPNKAEDRFKVAEKVLNWAVKEHGMDKKNVFVDTLTLSLSSNQSEVMETVKAISMVRDKLDLCTVLGVSNVSYGLPMRENLNSTFLTLALDAGLNCAIINPGSEKMRTVFDSIQVIKGFDTYAVKYVGRYGNAEKDAGAVKAKPTDPVSALKQAVIDGDDVKAVASVKELLDKGKPAIDIATESLIPAIEVVGRYFKEGRYFLPQVVMSAQAMKKSFDIIKSKMNIDDVKYDARVVMATVQGDIHDIGKNIVSTLLETNGFEVIDLGKSVPASEIVEKVKQFKPDFVGLSALMTTTMEEMPKVINELHKAGIKSPVMVGGAVITAEFAYSIGAKFYAKDAMEAVDVLKKHLKK